MVILLTLGILLNSRLPEPVWIEGEEPTTINVTATVAGWGHKEFLSGDKWLQIAIDAGKVEKELPADGALLSYRFSIGVSGPREIWNRIGYESVRSLFEWRIDKNPWKEISPEQLTIDMQEFQTWNEVAWLKMGDENLTAGTHLLEIRIPKTLDDKGKPARVLYASDALVINSGHFHPNGKFRPGAEYRTALDRRAAATRFEVKDQPAPARQTVELGGDWEIARDDELLPRPVATPIERLPADPIWYGIQVPSDKNEARSELTMAHRVWYRTRVLVPPGQIGRSFRLTFPQNNLNTTVYVNGVQCGFNKNPFVSWSCDITQAVSPGENQIWVGIRDAWYGYSSSPTDPMKLRRAFVIPLAFTGNGFQDLAYPEWHAFMSGILETPKLIVGGPLPVTDVFVKPSVSSKAVYAEITVLNTMSIPARGTIDVEVVDDHSGGLAKHLGSVDFELGAGKENTVRAGGPWTDPELWWPDSPHMYRLRTTVKMNGVASDVSETPFGFREWSKRGKDLVLNGIVWHGWAELTQGRSKEEWLKNFQRTSQRFMRLTGPSQNGGVRWQGLSYADALDWFDRNGVVVRRCGPLDGEAIGYYAVENDPNLQALYHSRIKTQLLENWRDQMVAQVRGERNHPSIGMWSIENEWLYINCINLYGDLMDDFEREEKLTLDALNEVDPTRPAMADGGGAGKGSIFPIHGDHYVYTNDPNRYPDLAYAAFPEGGGRGRWSWDQQRPRYIGEEFFATGINPADYAWIEGEQAFGGKVESEKGMAMVQRMLTEGYRWSGRYAAWHLWIGSEGAAYGKYVPNSERAVFCRQQDWTFGSGQRVRRTFGIFNDSHDVSPAIFTYLLKVDGRTVVTRRKAYSVAPGSSQVFDESLTMPSVDSRQAGELVLTLKVKGVDVFRDSKPLTVLPPPLATHTTGNAWLGVYDPRKRVIPLLQHEGFKPAQVADLASIPSSVRVLVVGPDALTEGESVQSALAAFASEGRRVVVLDQTYPLHYQALPVQIDASKDGGAYAFPEFAEHPAFAGLTAVDFRGWSDGVYRNAYAKPESGARSLLQVGSRLSKTALIEIPVGQGLLLLSQVQTAGGPSSSAVKGRYLRNLVEYARTYRLHVRAVAVAAADDPALLTALRKLGLRYVSKANPIEAIASTGIQIAVVSASPVNLSLLVQNLSKVKAFVSGGGTLIFHGLTPAGLADYDRIVGVDHMIRPYRREKVSIRLPRDPLAAGLSNSNVVMYSGEKMFDFNDDRFVASDIFSYVVDLDDAAPFAALADDYLYNTVNGFVSADGWKYIYSFDLDHTKPGYTMKFPQPQEFTEMTWIGNAFYHKVSRLSLNFDGKETVDFSVQPNDLPQTLSISRARRARTIELNILDWTRGDPGANVVGIDNISLKVKRSAAYYGAVHPLLNSGGLVRYSLGKGNFVLANVLLKDREEVPENADKKLAILSTILHNLNAPFAGARTVIPGAKNIEFQPVDISKRANQYRGDRGWFGDKARTFTDLPAGRHVFAGVPFEVFDFPTSPVPNSVMLGGSGVPGGLPDSVAGIPVSTKASALFFLQAARIDLRLSGEDVRSGKKFELAEYVIHYADGQDTTIPIYAELNVDDYRQEIPKPLAGAQLGWVHRYADGKQSAVAYVQQWNNPRPDVAILSIDLRYGSERRGVPVLLAVTAAK